MDQVLVTGGAGFIGSHLVRALVERGTGVRVLDNLSTGSRDRLADIGRNVELIEGDIRDRQACDHAVQGAQAIFHLAAYISVPGSVANPELADEINIQGTLNLLLAARDAGVSRFIFSSSSAVYGDTEVLPTPETVVPMPTSPYGVEKLYGEHMCRLCTSLYGMEAVALRYFNVYGPGQNPQSEYAAVIPKFMTMLLQGRAPAIFGDGEQTRDFLYVGDVVKANLLAATAEGAVGQVFNIAGGQATTLNALYSQLKTALGSNLDATHGPERAGDIRHSSADISKARKGIGFEPEYDLARGLVKTAEYYTRNGG